MNTEITLKGITILRSGYSERGFVSANTLLSIPLNKASKNAVVKYLGARIGRINNLYYSDLRDGRVELHCDITFTGNFIMLADMVRDKALYPVCVINTQENEAWLSEIFFAPAEDREFDEQEPIDLSELRELVNSVARPKPTNAFIPFSEDTKFTPVLEMRFIGKALETRLSLNNKTLGHVHSYRAHIGKPETNSEDVFHLQELHIQFHEYILKELLSKASFVQD